VKLCDRCTVRAATWALAALGLLLLAAGPVGAQDRTDIPLKNWGGFAVYRDAVYDDLERLVTAGLADRVILDTKPLSRIEAARIVARAIQKIRNDDTGAYNARRDLEAVLGRLTEEFRPELQRLGVPTGAESTASPGFFTVLPVDRAQVGAGYANHNLRLINSQGVKIFRGGNEGLTFESRGQVGDLVSFYLQPELLANEEYGAARLATGYAKLTLFNVELAVGRESLWWGPALHGSLILSDNGPPLDQIRIGSAEPFLLPWIGKWVGPMKIVGFVAQLEDSPQDPHTKLSGIRVTIAPFSFLELGASRTIMFDGDNRPRLPLSEYRLVLDPTTGDSGNQKFRTNNLAGVDADLRLRNVDRYYLPARDMRLYGEFYWDDTCGECGPSSGFAHWFDSNFLPNEKTIGWRVGVQWLGVLDQNGLDARVEYARTSIESYNHSQFRDGYVDAGYVLGDFIGTDGEDVYGRMTYYLTPDLMLGVDLDRAVLGNTLAGFAGPKERRVGGGLDLSYRFWKRYSIFAQYHVMDVKNRNFKPGDDGLDHLFRLELTRSFR